MSTDDVDDLGHIRASIVLAVVSRRGRWAELTPDDIARLDKLADDYARETERFERELGIIPADDKREPDPPSIRTFYGL